jgi:hypothetical protein
MKTESNPCLSVSNRFRELLSAPGISSYGAWSTFTWDRQGVERHGARLVPDHAPWRDLFAALDAEGAALSSDPVSKVDEADAIVACCWRYGSYAHVLTTGELYPPFRTNPRLSRISDDEMKRINQEFSSGLAAWWSDRAPDPAQIYRRVRAALTLLPMPWRDRRPEWWDRYITARGAGLIDSLSQAAARHPETETSLSEMATVRQEANYLVHNAYRNRSVESLHAGSADLGSNVPGFVRLYAEEIRKLCYVTAEDVAIHIILREHSIMDVFRRVFLHLFLGFPSDWSVTDETASVEYTGFLGSGPLAPRLRSLAERYPTVYASALAANSSGTG